MATIKSSFHVRKSSRLCTKKVQNKLLEKCDTEGLCIKSHSNLEYVIDHGSPNKVQSDSFRSSSFLTEDDTAKSPPPSSKSFSSPRTPVSLKYFTPDSLTRHSSTHLLSGISNDDLTKTRRCMFSPTKRKSDDENEISRCSISPVKTMRPSAVDTSFVKSSLSVLSPVSPLRFQHSPAAETPKSSRRPNKTMSTVPTSTPRRLFGSPSKLDSKSEAAAPLKDKLDTFHQSCYSPSVLSTPPRPRSAAKPYQSAKRCLHTAKPDRLIGRDAEFTELEDFICDKLDNGISGSLYVSGAPGTGKTVVVNHVISKLQSEYDGLRTAFINCMTLKDPNAVLLQIHEQLIGSSVKAKDSIRAVESLFTTCDDSILVVLDEIDQLDSKHHHILYRIFEWPALENSKLMLIGIANALDLTDRVLPRLQASKTCRPTLMNFRPYTSIQITDILKHRLQRDCVVEPSAVNFCARKVSAVAGDVRKALDICRRAVEIVESEARCQLVLKPTDCNSPTKKGPPAILKKVTITHISKVMSDVYGSSVSAANSSENDVPLQQKLAVCSLLVLVKNRKLKEVQLGKLHETYTKVCRHQQLVPVDQSEFNSLLSLLDSRGVVMLKKAKDTRLTKVSLKLDEQELEQTLKDKVLMASILKDGIPK